MSSFFISTEKISRTSSQKSENGSKGRNKKKRDLSSPGLMRKEEEQK